MEVTMNHFAKHQDKYLFLFFILSIATICLLPFCLSTKYTGTSILPKVTVTDITIMNANNVVIKSFSTKDKVYIKKTSESSLVSINKNQDYLIETYDSKFNKTFIYLVRYPNKYMITINEQ